MARPRAADYEGKRQQMLEKAASLFASAGYEATSMQEIADAAGVSKALVYHYYRAKADLLFDMIEGHLKALAATVSNAARPSEPAEAQFRGFVAAVLEAYRDADDLHKVQLAHLGALPPERQVALRAIERDLVRHLVAILRALAPKTSETHLTPLAMSIFGTLNWKYLWFRPGRGIGEHEYADLVSDLFLNGLRATVQKRPSLRML
jgi:TetR/AcrR family transcriptional regulator